MSLESTETTWKRFGGELGRITIVAVVVSLLTYQVVYPLLNLGDNMPMPARTLAIWITITWLLSKGGTGWKTFGLSKPKLWRTLLVIFGLIVYELLLATPLTNFIYTTFQVEPPNYESLTFIQGNTAAFIYFLVLSIGIGGFVEEMIFRGYLMTRIEQVLGKRRGVVLVSLLMQSLIFGLFHVYQGPGGILATGLQGLVFGLAYVASGRNLWAGIIIHALMDCAGITLLYLNGTTAI